MAMIRPSEGENNLHFRAALRGAVLECRIHNFILVCYSHEQAALNFPTPQDWCTECEIAEDAEALRQ